MTSKYQGKQPQKNCVSLFFLDSSQFSPAFYDHTSPKALFIHSKHPKKKDHRWQLKNEEMQMHQASCTPSNTASSPYSILDTVN